MDNNVRIDMENPIFRKLQNAIEHPCRSRDWFGMAEQAINTVYALGEHPDDLCNNLINNLTRRAFTHQRGTAASADPANDPDPMDEDLPEVVDVTQNPSIFQEPGQEAKDTGDAFELSQLLFAVGHVAIKHIVYLELVEREWKRQKHERELGERCLASDLPIQLLILLAIAEKLAAGTGNASNPAKDGEELDQVAGNAEDEIGERIAGIRESELLYGPDSLLALYGPLLVHICGSPHKFKVSR